MPTRQAQSGAKLDAFRLAREHGVVEGSVDAHRLSRVADVLAHGPADVAWRGIIAVGHPGHGQPGIESRDLLHGVEVTEVQGQREPVDERSGGSVVPQFGGNDGSPDHDMNRGSR